MTLHHKIRTLLISFWALGSLVWAQSNPAVEKDCEILEEVHTFAVQNEAEATETIYIKYKVYNEKGVDKATARIWYDKFVVLKKIEGQVLNGDESVVLQKKIESEDMLDLAAISANFYDDNRIRLIRLRASSFPYVVTYKYEVFHKGLISYPKVHLRNPFAASKKSRFVLSFPHNAMNVRYKMQAFDQQPQIKVEAAQKTLTWEFPPDLPALPDEPLSPDAWEGSPRLLLAPDIFSYAQQRGSMKTWQSFGLWIQGLYANRQMLSPEKVAFLKNLTAQAQTPLEKAKLVYEHLQKTTRYISVQLGIGGFQPFEASYVEQKQYGDCKALTNYLQAMLAAVGVTAYPVLVYAGQNEGRFDTDFPMNAFNHVILAIPNGSDYVWLEATSSTQPFGWLGDFTEDRPVLVVKPTGGELAQTPASTAIQNTQTFEANVRFDPEATAHIDLTSTYGGNQADDLRAKLRTKTPKEREEWLQATLDLRSLSLQNAVWEAIEQNEPTTKLQFKLKATKFYNRSGSRIFLRLNALNRARMVLPKVDKRELPIHLPYSYLDQDVVRYELPVGFTVEAMPPPVKLQTGFGSYEASARIDGNVLVYTRKLEIARHKLPATDYEAFRTFFQQVTQADQMQAVLKGN